MSFMKYLIMKSASTGGFLFWLIIISILIVISLRFPPLVVILIGLFFRQFQNYIEFKDAAKQQESSDSPKHLFSGVLRVFIPLFSIAAVVGFVVFANHFLKRFEDMDYTFYMFLLIIFYTYSRFIFKARDGFRKRSLEDENAYLFENKYASSQKIQKIELKKLRDKYGEATRNANSSPSSDMKKDFPPNINPKLYIKPREQKPNILSYEGSKPVTLLSEEYAKEVSRIHKLKREQDKVLVQAANKLVKQDASRTAFERDNSEIIQCNGEEFSREALKQQVRVYKKEPLGEQVKEQVIKGEKNGFKLTKNCSVCGNRRALERNGRHFCEFCGAQLD